MDKASAIGLAIAVFCLGFVLNEVSHGHFMMFYSQEGVLLVFGGSISVTFLGMPMDKVKCIPGYIKRFLFNKGRTPAEAVKLMSDLADKARRDGILALEGEVAKIQQSDKFLAQGLRMAIDGMDPSNIEATLRMELMAMTDRHKAGK